MWGLDNHHDVNDPPRANKYATRLALDPLGPDQTVQQFTVNLFGAMGVHPSTLSQVSNKDKIPLVQGEELTDRVPPVVQGISYSTVDGIVLVNIRASDEGGVVAGVEVTLDGGAHWHPAERTGESWTEWLYTYGEEEYQLYYFGYELNSIRVGARAIDDSLNIGNAVFAEAERSCESED